ncbi:TorF family putative porin [Litorimonas sp. RW-G-Af-16]|uniref:TorF family putative porin n=1 Tax=Litorimonas sp. RW-G-Af-16 TaxID=3241168 RepID=UPI00390C4334
MKKLLLGSAALIAASAAPLAAQAQDISVTTGVDVVTDYVFRGVSLADTAVQPYVEVSSGAFTAGAWFSTGLGDTSLFAADEVDLYLGYSVPTEGAISLDFGVTYYHYPQFGSLFSTSGSLDDDFRDADALDDVGDILGLDEDDIDGAFEDLVSGTYEVSASVGFDSVLSPSVTAYYDLTLEALTLEGGISHSVPVSDKTSFDLGATVGLVSVDGDGDYEYGQLSASLGYAFTDAVSGYVGANYALSSEDTLGFKKTLLGDPKDNLLFFGAGVSAGF